MQLSSTVTLHGGISIPRLGLGVYQAGRGRATQDAVRWALEAGYRHIDTVAMYGNEGDVGAALRQAIAAGQVRCDEVFVTTKVWNSDHGYDEALRAFDASARRLGLEVGCRCGSGCSLPAPTFGEMPSWASATGCRGNVIVY